MTSKTLAHAENAWTWAARLVPIVLLFAGLYLAANYVSKAELAETTNRIEQLDASQSSRLASHDITLAVVRGDLQHIAATLERLEKQNAAILERLPARGPPGRD